MAKIVFCQKVVYAYFGVMTISAVLKKHGHTVDLVMGADADRAACEIVALKPDIVAFSTLTATGEFEWAVEVARNVKQRNEKLLTIFGGVHPTIFPEDTMKDACVDLLCRGEGEYAMLELCNRLDKRINFDNIPNLWVRTSHGIVENQIGQLIDNLDDLPFPDRDLYQKYRYFDNLGSIDVLAGRGCPFDCTFCYNHVFRQIYNGKGKFIKKRSVDNTISELVEVRKKFNPRSLTFVDELFTLDKKWLKDFVEKYPDRVGLPFICSVRADTVDEDIVSMLAAAGAFRVCLGLETGNEELRNKLLNKKLTNAQFERAANTLHRHGIKFLTTNMVGLPGETVDNAFETVEFNRHIKADFVWHSILQPYPKLEITRRLESMGCISPLNSTKFDTTYFKGSMLKQDNIKELVNMHKIFYVAFKLPWLKPFFRMVIKLPPNFIFDGIFVLSFGWLQVSCFRRNPVQLLLMGIGNLKVFSTRPETPGLSSPGMNGRP